MKTVHLSNYRVEVRPELWRIGDVETDHAHMVNLCRNLATSINRHVDHVQTCDVFWDSKNVCSFCGMEWETESNGEPLCCSKACAEWEAAEAAKVKP